MFRSLENRRILASLCSKAKIKAEDMCKKLLANLVIENYKIIEIQ